MTEPEIRQQLERALALLDKLKDRQARGAKVRASIITTQACIRYLSARLREES